MRQVKVFVTSAAALALMAAAPASAQHSFNIADGNSLVHFNTDPAFAGNRIGMDQWVVDGVNHMYNQWFWYRVGSGGPERRINTLPRTFVGTFNTNADPADDTFTVRYQDANNLFQIEASFRLTGGGLLSGTSDVLETIRITNLTNTTLPYHFFQYCDLDLNNDIVDESVAILAPQFNTAIQTDGPLVVTETSALPFPDRHEVNIYPATITRLDDALTDILNNNAGPLAGPPRQDFTWAFQWDVDLAPSGSPGSTLLISKDKLLVPAPATLTFLGAGLLGLRRRRR